MSDLLVDLISEVDRSTLQKFATCPMQARLTEGQQVVGNAAVVGEQVHIAVGATIQAWIDSDANMSRKDVVDTLEQNLRSSRPDVQPEVIDAYRASVWGFATYLCGINPINLKHFDGGVGERSGQLSADIEHIGLRVTAELDLVHATESKEVIRDLDQKSGRGLWLIDDIRDDFQFGMHAWLLFQKYPSIEVVQVAVWMTRFGRRSPWVDFPRKRMPELHDRILAAADSWARYERRIIEEVPVWPSVEKCRICDAATRCKAAERDFGEDAPSMLDKLVAVDAIGDALRKKLAAISDKTGRRIESSSGARAGRDKPSTRKPTFSVWSEKSGDDDE